MVWYALFCYTACFVLIRVANRYWIKPQDDPDRELFPVLCLAVWLFSPVTLWVALFCVVVTRLGPSVGSLFGVRDTK